MITPEPGIIIAGRYTLTGLLGRGGMGSVWLARHRDLGIDVAVKFMAPALVAAADARMRFEREARVAAPLSSQHVVQTYDYGVEDGTPYIIMELLKGESLSARLARERHLTPQVAARLLQQICKALGTAHEAGLVHRDIKPANIFLARKDNEEVVKILDFGIAKITGYGEAHAETATGMVLGSAHYMSPEQIRSSKGADHRSDLWSVGIILYRMLTGHLPFSGVDLGDVLVRVCTDVCAPPSLLAPQLPESADRFFERALARDPDERFQSAMELAAEFEAMALAPRTPSPPTTAQGGGTMVIRPTPMATTDGVAEVMRDSAPTVHWAGSSPPEVPTAAPRAAEVDPGSTSAMLVSGPVARSPPQIVRSRAKEARRFRRVLGPAVVVVMVSLAGAFRATLRGEPTASGHTEERNVAVVELPPTLSQAPSVVAPTTTSSAPALSAAPAVSAAMTASAAPQVRRHVTVPVSTSTASAGKPAARPLASASPHAPTAGGSPPKPPVNDPFANQQ